MSAAVLDCRCHVRKLRPSAPPEPTDAPGRCMAFDAVVARAISELGVQLADPEVRIRFNAAEAILRLKMAELRHSRDVFVLSARAVACRLSRQSAARRRRPGGHASATNAGFCAIRVDFGRTASPKYGCGGVPHL